MTEHPPSLLSSAPSSPSARSWVALALVQSLWRRFHHDSRALGSEAWRRWGVALAIGAAANAVIAFVVTRMAQSMQERGLQAWDERTMIWLVEAVPLTFENGINWESPGSISYLAPLVIGFALFAAWRSRPLLAVSMVAIYLLQHAFIFIGWGLWNRPRPDLIAGGVAAPDLHSFPSGHAALSMSIYGFFAYLWMRESRNWIERVVALAVTLFWIVLVGVSRIELGSHWPSDVLGGFALGLAWLIAVIVALRRAEGAGEKVTSVTQGERP